MKKFKTRATLAANVHVTSDDLIAVNIVTSDFYFLHPAKLRWEDEKLRDVGPWDAFGVDGGWVYVYNESLAQWTELRVTLGDDEIDCYQVCYQGAEPPAVRDPYGPLDHFFYVRERHQYRVAISRVKWSRERFQSLQDPSARSARMASPLVCVEHASDPDVKHAGRIEAPLGRAPNDDRPFIAPLFQCRLQTWSVPDPLRRVRALASAYQDHWIAMKECVESIEEEPLRECAAIIQTVHAVAENLQSDLEELDLPTVEQVLQTKRRDFFRREIELIKQALVSHLRKDTLLSGLVEALDDYVHLPPENEDDESASYGDLWAVIGEILTWIAYPPYALDLDIIRPDSDDMPKKKDRFGRDDPGLELLVELSDPAAGHPLHARLFPEFNDSIGPREYYPRPAGDPRFNMQRFDASLQVGRKTFESLFKFCAHFALLGIDATSQSAQKSIVSLITLSDNGLKNVIVKMDDYFGGKSLPGDDMFIYTYFTGNEAPVTGYNKERDFRSPPVDLPDGTKANFGVFAKFKNHLVRIGGHILKAMRESTEVLGKKWHDFRGNSLWKEIEIEVVIMTKPKGGLIRAALDNRRLLRLVAIVWLMLEEWNFNSAVRALAKKGADIDLKTTMAVLSSAADLTLAMREFVKLEAAATALEKSKPLQNAGALTLARLKAPAFERISLASSIISYLSSVSDFYDSMNEKRYGVALGHLLQSASSFVSILEGSVALRSLTLGRNFGLIGLGIAVIGTVAVWYFTDSQLKEWVRYGPFWQGNPRKCEKSDWVLCESDEEAEFKMRGALVNALIGVELLVAYTKDPATGRWIFEPYQQWQGNLLDLGVADPRLISQVAVMIHDPLHLLSNAVFALEANWSTSDPTVILVGISPVDKSMFRKLSYLIGWSDTERSKVALDNGKHVAIGEIEGVDFDESGAIRLILGVPDEVRGFKISLLKLELDLVIDALGDGCMTLEKRSLVMEGLA